MEGHGETMRLVANGLDEMQNRRESVENDRLVFLSQHVNDLFAFGDRGQRLVDDADRFQRVRGGVQLPQAAIDQDQPGHRLAFGEQPRIAPRHHFVHAGEIVVAFHRADDEFAIVRLLHPAVFPHHHAGDFVRALDVRDVETLDALGRLGQPERFLHRRLNRHG